MHKYLIINTSTNKKASSLTYVYTVFGSCYHSKLDDVLSKNGFDVYLDTAERNFGFRVLW